MKAPALQWYPGDWRRDTALQSCPIRARGLWAEMLWLMHDGTPYGHLATPAGAIAPKVLARLVGMPYREIVTDLAVLKRAGVYSITNQSVIFSRRMVRDETARQRRATGGQASTREDQARSRRGTTGRLFNFLFHRYGGCLWCKRTQQLELHRVVPGRRGGKYEPGNVVLLCGDDHKGMEGGHITVEALLGRVDADTLTALFEGFGKGIEYIPFGHEQGYVKGYSSGIPPASASASASAERKTHPDPMNGFDQFKAVYPKREKWPDAEKAWRQVEASPHLAAILADVIRRRATEDWRKDKGKWIPLPASYLRGRRWEDESLDVGSTDEDPYAGQPHLWDCACGEVHEGVRGQPRPLCPNRPSARGQS